MSLTPAASDAPKPAAWKPLGPEQRRVLGVMIEKAKTTPAGYPMSINGIVVGCNQKSNRDPLMSLDDDDVERAVDELRELGVVIESPEVFRVAKFRHRAYEWLGVNRAELAVMTELLLRGAQTLGDLRVRAARMEPIPDQTALKPLVDALVQRGLMIELTAPGRGQIVSHRLYKEPELVALRAEYAGNASRAAASANDEVHSDSPAPRTISPAPAPALADDRFARLSTEVAELRGEVAGLRGQVRELESRLTAVPDEREAEDRGAEDL